MPITLFRYTYIRLCIGFVFFTVIFASLNWVNLLVRSIDLLLAEIQYPSYLLQHMILVFVVALDRVIPISAFLATVYVVIKMRNNHEFTIQQSMGLGKLGISFPIIAFAMTVALIEFTLKFEFRPHSDNKIVELVSELEWTLDKYRIKPGRFLDFQDGRTIITEGVGEDGELNNLVIHFESQGNENARLWVTAKTGEINYSPDEKEFVLSDGQVLSQVQMEKEDETMVVIKFRESLTFTEERITKAFNKKLSTTDIIERVTSKEGLSTRLKLDIHERVNRIFFSFFTVLCGGILLILGYKKNWNSVMTIFIASSLVLGSYVLGKQLESAVQLSQSFPQIQYISTIPMILFFLGWTIIKWEKKTGPLLE
ncbi:MAG: LptF/LptG family permease [Rhodobacteraceae bacterium]|nr:LptF/LptG family permease [Paracoccaceae bacterium]MYI90486.1 LptF/LptG family permease [Paracoccaceae bacterium]MYJ87224.1 LptF/LptG family permease [Paracoccaceae bacterium]